MLAIERQLPEVNENHYRTIVTDWFSRWYGHTKEMQTERPVEMKVINAEASDEQPRGAADAHLSSPYSGTAASPSPTFVDLPVSSFLARPRSSF